MTHPVRRSAALAAALLLTVVALAGAHDMFLKPHRYFVDENADVLVRVINGTFSKSENSIARPRVRDISLVSPAGRAQLDTAAWSIAGDTSTFTVRSGAAGTYVIGASTRPSFIALQAREFNKYLADDGIPDVLAERRRAGILAAPARERYSKHIKALIQVGKARSDEYATRLGYPVEIVPLENPYVKAARNRGMRFLLLVDGKPTPNQYVQWGGRNSNGARVVMRATRSDANGVATVPLRGGGTWFVKFISMVPVTSDSVDYESRWASLTFQTR